VSRERRFRVGDTAEFSGVRFRVVTGDKSSADLRLDWLTPRGWVPVSAAAIFYMVDMIAENEDVLYPVDESGRGRGPMGGEYLMAKCRTARIRGWRYAWEELERERARKAERAAS